MKTTCDCGAAIGYERARLGIETCLQCAIHTGRKQQDSWTTRHIVAVVAKTKPTVAKKKERWTKRYAVTTQRNGKRVLLFQTNSLSDAYDYRNAMSDLGTIRYNIGGVRGIVR